MTPKLLRTYKYLEGYKDPERTPRISKDLAGSLRISKASQGSPRISDDLRISSDIRRSKSISKISKDL